MTTLEELLTANAQYIAAGFATCRIAPGLKGPEQKEAKGWNARTAADAEFSAGDSIGIQSGPISGAGTDDCCLMTVDLDMQSAVDLADQFLPETAMVDGRPGKLRSHRHYLVPFASVPPEAMAVKGKAFNANIRAGRNVGPRTVQRLHPDKGPDDETQMIVELRGTGAQTVAPPSMWTSKDGTRTERREWEGGTRGEPARVEYPVLLAAVTEIAKACGWKPKPDRACRGARGARKRVSGRGQTAPQGSGVVPVTATSGVPKPTPPEWLRLYAEAEIGDGTVTIDGVAHSGDENERRAGLYLAAIPDSDLSRWGNDGDGRYLAQFNVICHGFLVRQPVRLHRLADEYDARLRALAVVHPNAGYIPWDNHAEREHKFDHAKQPPPPDDPETKQAGHKLTEVRTADRPDDPHRLARLIADFGDGLPTLWFWRDQFHRYAGGCYRPVPDGELRAEITAAVRAEFVRLNQLAVKRHYAGSDRDKPPPTAIRVTVPLVNNVVLALRGMTLLPSVVDAPAWVGGCSGPPACGIVAFPNGLLHLPGYAAGAPGAFTAPTAGFFSPAVLGFQFIPDPPAPVAWLTFLNQLWPDDPASIQLLREWFGYCLTSDTSQEKLVFIVGPKRAGKGTIFRVLRALVGADNCAGLTLASLAGEFGLSAMVGKSVGLIADVRLGNRADVGVVVERLLSITGEDTLPVNRKHLPILSCRLPTRLTLASNELPRLADPSGALAGRMLLLRLTQTFYGVEDTNLEEKLLAELPGIFTWAVAGWRSLTARGRFEQPASGVEMIHELEDLASPIGAFIREKCVTGPTARVAANDLFVVWRAWALDTNRDPGTRQVFGRDLLAAMPSLKVRKPNQGGERWTEYVGVAPKTVCSHPKSEGVV